MPATELAGPVRRGERIQALDVIRGFALLGILLMNIQYFSMISAAYFNPTAYGDLTGLNYVVWLLSHMFADQKFMTIFAMLFGAGIVLMAERAEAVGTNPAWLHYRRMFLLVLIGLMHAHLLFYGDILFMYGVTAFVVYWFRRLPAPWVIALGLAMLMIGSGLYLSSGSTVEHWPEEVRAAFASDWAPSEGKVATELAAYRGGWFDQASHRTPYAIEFETRNFTFWGFWRSGGLMLIGMGLFKLKVFQLADLRRFAFPAMAIGGLIGLPIVAFGVYQNTAHGWTADFSFWFGIQYNYWGSILVSFGWIGLILWLMTLNGFAPLGRRLSAVGQMALSNYILQSLICSLIFYGTGLGLFGSVERTGQILIVFGVWVIQLIVSPLWLAQFRYGPLEWVWRSLTYGRAQPLVRKIEA